MVYKRRDQVVLVNEMDEQVGLMDKLEAHQKGLLHRAFSVFLFNDKNELLLQQRAFDKYHGGGLWTNTCCSHPQVDEHIISGAQERLEYEMGMSCTLEHMFHFIYNEPVENNLIEHELDHILVGYSNQHPKINNDEVNDYKWMPIDILLKDITLRTDQYTIWFKQALPNVIKKVAL